MEFSRPEYKSGYSSITSAGDQTQVSHIAGGFFTGWDTREAQDYWNG